MLHVAVQAHGRTEEEACRLGLHLGEHEHLHERDDRLQVAGAWDLEDVHFGAQVVARLTMARQAFSRRTPAERTRSSDARPFSMSGPAMPSSALCGEARAPREVRMPTMT